jgi:ATP-binding cassette subfamily C (CFTR/MRP) protein 4
VEFRDGAKVGLVGRSGGGKSTLFAALLRLVELETGKIVWDGVELRQVAKRRLRRHIVVIPQEAIVFRGTLRYNLDPFSSHSDAEIRAALNQARIAHLALDEALAELSVGERALVCLARAFVRAAGAKLVLLDEANSALDAQTDAFIQHQVTRAHFSRATVLVIAHRLETVIGMDSILVMDAGAVVEQGAPRDLLQRADSAFSKLVGETGEDAAGKLKAAAAWGRQGGEAS